MRRVDWTETHWLVYRLLPSSFKWAIVEPKSEDIYAGIVEAVLAAKHNKDGDDNHKIPHVGLPVVDSPLFIVALDCIDAEYKGSIDHVL